ncbi:MAG TPA: RHS repeat-associated core domain-containing protein, partial [Pyrinomonadaceae bacterium]|nr:RHS repeat-associated core domain-containing protein [Pyrinomonadaceae bacterium]
TGPLQMPDTNWTLTTITKTGIELSAGQHVVRLVADTNAGNGVMGDIDYLKFDLRTAAPSQQQPAVDINWLVSDHLGTPRMIVDKTGSLSGIKRHDYLPFGEELAAGAGGRSAEQGYIAEPIRQKFTQYERDAETGADYAQARYFSSTHGRFTSTDPLYFQFSMALDPQRFNLYAYGRNNPLKWTDPDGERVHLRGDTDWLTTNVLYEMVGGQETFDRYFQIRDGQVVMRAGVDISQANGGVQELAGLVNATENYLYFAGTDGTAAADLFQGSRNERGRVTQLGRNRADDFTGNNEQGRGGSLVGTSGREHTLQPANLANGDPVFAVIAYNTNAVFTQVGISTEYTEPAGRLRPPLEFAAQTEGAGQVIRPVSFFIHESAENRRFSQIGASNANYNRAHTYAMHREATIRRELRITGGFSGGVVRRRVAR